MFAGDKIRVVKRCKYLGVIIRPSLNLDCDKSLEIRLNLDVLNGV